MHTAESRSNAGSCRKVRSIHAAQPSPPKPSALTRGCDPPWHLPIGWFSAPTPDPLPATLGGIRFVFSLPSRSGETPAQWGWTRAPTGAPRHRQSHRQATHPGFVLASRGVKALGDEVSLFKMCLGEAAAFFISQDSLKFRKREREREGKAKGEGLSEGPRGRIE